MTKKNVLFHPEELIPYDDVAEVCASQSAGVWLDYATVKDESDRINAFRLAQQPNYRIRRSVCGQVEYFKTFPLRILEKSAGITPELREAFWTNLGVTAEEWVLAVWDGIPARDLAGTTHPLQPVAAALRDLWKDFQKMKVVQFTASSEDNEKLWQEFSYYTLCKLQEAIGYGEVNAHTVARAVQNGAKGVLTLDDLGNFVRWE